MKRIPFSGLRFRLLLLVLLAVLPPLGLMLSTAWEQRRTAADDAKANVLRLARLAASNQSRSISGVRQLVIALSQLSEVRGGDPVACSRLLARLEKQYPIYANFGAINPDGEIFCSAIPIRGRISAADRLYFRRAKETRNFAVGEYQIGRITGKPTLNFGYPILNDAGQVQAIIFAALDLSSLNQLAAEVQLPEGAALTVIDRRGTILARHPDPGQWVGRSLPDASIVRTTLALEGEGMAEAIGLDGVSRLYAFAPVGGAPDAGIYVSIGLLTDRIFADLDQLLKRNMAGLALVAVLALVAAWAFGDLFIVRQVKTLVATTKRLSQGDLSGRSGVTDGKGELNQLARAFDEMAEAMEIRQSEARRAQDQIRKLNEELEMRVAQRTAELEDANKQLEAFSYSVSHDLRAPLRAIDGFSRIVLDDYSGHLGEEGQRFLKVIRANATKMGDLIDDLLAFSRLGRMDLQKSLVDMTALAQSVADELVQELGRSIDVRVEPLDPARADNNMMRQVFVNLISNALKFTRLHPNPSVTIACHPEGNQHVYSVADNGVGFDMAYVNKLFGVFQRLHSQQEFEGTGVGLALVQRIVHRHGGKVWAEGKVTEGATIYFALPRDGDIAC